MFKHLFKLIWNKKKQNFLLISEILISFMVMFSVFTLIVYYYQNYKKPMGFEYEHQWIINYNNSFKTTNSDSLALFYETLRQTIKSMPQVKDASFTSHNTPMSQNRSTGEVVYNKKKVDNVNWYQVEDGYKNVLNLKMAEGRWFDRQDIINKNKSVVINTTLKEALFGNGEAIGKLLGDDKNKTKIIGVVQDLKVNGDYAASGSGIYIRVDTSMFHWLGKILIKVSPDADAAFESQLYKKVAGYMKNADIEIVHMASERKSKNYFTLIPMTVLLIVACFLIINVALGLFGVLWYNINKRRGEIGLRRAVGATGNSVSSQLVAEAMILATFSLIIGTFFAVQFPLLNVFNLPAGIYIMALFLSIAFIYLLVFACSLYPGKQAAAIYPAVALHEE